MLEANEKMFIEGKAIYKCSVENFLFEQSVKDKNLEFSTSVYSVLTDKIESPTASNCVNSEVVNSQDTTCIQQVNFFIMVENKSEKVIHINKDKIIGEVHEIEEREATQETVNLI